MRRLAQLLGIAVLVASTSLFGAGSASAGPLPLSQCSTTSGVILAVDFSHFGGSIYRSCFSTPTSGYAMLNSGGWATDGTQHDGPAFICRIGYSGFNGGTRYPTDYPCVNTPPASAYWSYWHADANVNHWSYSKAGAMRTSPGPGSVDAWVFGGTDVGGGSGGPSFSPDEVRAHNTAPAGGGSGGSGGGSGSGGSGSGSGGSGAGSRSGSGGSGAGGGSGSGGSAQAGTGPDAKAGGQATTPRGSAASTHASTSRLPAKSAAPAKTSASARLAGTSGAGGPSPSTSSTSAIVDAQPAADAKHSAGSYLPEMVAAAVLLILGAFTGLQFWRRRQAGPQL